jgi:DNA polymerase-1
MPELTHANGQIRAAAERVAINMPVQGTAADVIKVAMINLHRALQEGGYRTKMILQVHDELLFEVPRDELDAMQRLVPEYMASAIPLVVPLKVDVGVGANWGDLLDVEEDADLELVGAEA